IRVYSRIRPFTKKEKEDKEDLLLKPGKNDWTMDIMEKVTDVYGKTAVNKKECTFDHVFHWGMGYGAGNGSQAEVFEECKDFAELSTNGINTCIFAYGQSGTGKTYTMAGVKPSESNGMSDVNLGLKPRMIRYVYELKKQMRHTLKIKISC